MEGLDFPKCLSAHPARCPSTRKNCPGAGRKSSNVERRTRPLLLSILAVKIRCLAVLVLRRTSLEVEEQLLHYAERGQQTRSCCYCCCRGGWAKRRKQTHTRLRKFITGTHARSDIRCGPDHTRAFTNPRKHPIQIFRGRAPLGCKMSNLVFQIRATIQHSEGSGLCPVERNAPPQKCIHP